MKKLLFSVMATVGASLVAARAGETVEVTTVEALATALASASSGDAVELADGVYCPTETLVVPSGVTLRSKNGRTSVVLTPGGGGQFPASLRRTRRASLRA